MKHWYEVVYYEDDGSDYGGKIVDHEEFIRKRDAIATAKKDNPEHHATVFYRSEEGDSGDGVWSRGPVKPKKPGPASATPPTVHELAVEATRLHGIRHEAERALEAAAHAHAASKDNFAKADAAARDALIALEMAIKKTGSRS